MHLAELLMLSSRGGRRLISILKANHLATNLKLCLDVADAESWPGSGDYWNDRSGLANNFLRGESVGAVGGDPTFHGTVGGLSVNEFWSFDGGDRFTIPANTAWINAMHKDNAQFTVAMWVYINAAVTGYSAALGLFGDTGAVAAGHHGVQSYIANSLLGSNNLVFLNVYRGANIVLYHNSVASIVFPRWNFIAISVNETTGAGIFRINSAVENFTSTYTSPTAADAIFPFEIAAIGNKQGEAPANTRMAEFAMWDRALSSAELTRLYDRTRPRFGV